MEQVPSEPHSRRFQAIGVQSAVDRVDFEIRRAFVAGVLEPGEELSMAELSAQLEVSHVPVREAMRRLEAQGLVIFRRGRSAVIAPLHTDEIEDVYGLWIMLSNRAAARSCAAYTKADLEMAEEMLGVFTSLPQASEDAFDAHFKFHRLLLAPGASEWDLRLLDILWPVIERAARLAYRLSAARAGQHKDSQGSAYATHRPLLDAARAEDVDLLQRSLRAHHESHMSLVVDALRREHDNDNL